MRPREGAAAREREAGGSPPPGGVADLDSGESSDSDSDDAVGVSSAGRAGALPSGVAGGRASHASVAPPLESDTESETDSWLLRMSSAARRRSASTALVRRLRHVLASSSPALHERQRVTPL